MQITDELLDHICRLAKLELPAEQRASIRADFENMLSFVSKLQEVDTEGVAPLIHMTDEVNHLRVDEGSNQLSQAEVLQNAPDRNDDFFKVPKVVKRGQ
ncbi:MAG: Asp-tRNA(Asn)/Glu-tRNA(Gln) amidotransferase subunit GatC [Bacteroidota bacterium]